MLTQLDTFGSKGGVKGEVCSTRRQWGLQASFRRREIGSSYANGMSIPALGEGKTINLSTSKIGTILELSENERGSASAPSNRSSGPILEIRARPIAGTNVQPQAV